MNDFDIALRIWAATKLAKTHRHKGGQPKYVPSMISDVYVEMEEGSAWSSYTYVDPRLLICVRLTDRRTLTIDSHVGEHAEFSFGTLIQELAEIEITDEARMAWAFHEDVHKRQVFS